MRVLLEGGGIDPRITDDPRWSQAQREAVGRAALADPLAEVRGLDAKMRPVVCAKLGGMARRSEYSLLRNGAPGVALKPLAEVWR